MDFSEVLKPGLCAEQTITVTKENAANAWGSGGLPVFATPAMIAFMEMTARSAVDPLLPQGWSTVGTELNVKHLAATPIGMKISAKAQLLSVDRRVLCFKVEAFDEEEKIGEGTHGRFIIENERFMAKVERKKASIPS